MAYTEFCCRSGGNNLNAGTRTGNSTVPGVTADFTFTAGSWVNATRTFTLASGNTTGVVAGADFAALDTGGTAGAFGGLVSAITSNTVVISNTSKWGTNPADGTYTLRIGGAWKGPNGTDTFPFNIINDVALATGNTANRVNFLNDANYNITTGLTHGNNQTRFQGFSVSYGDGGRFTLDGGTSGVSYNLINYTGNRCTFQDIIFQNNGASGSAAGARVAGHNSNWVRCIFNNLRGNGWDDSGSGSNAKLFECEAYACNQSNTSNTGGFAALNSTQHFIRCISHDNTGSNSVGFRFQAGVPTIHECIAETNGSHGVSANVSGIIMKGCDLYNNAGAGIIFTDFAAPVIWIENSNFIKNSAGYGIDAAASFGGCFGTIINCGFGAGTQQNSSGTIKSTIVADQIGLITYANDVTPWVDPANGDFRINLATAKGTGRGTFSQTAASYAGTIGYPDVGAAQHLETSHGFSLIGHGPAFGG